jgi:ABC-type glutathione transport system ATPase component
MQMVFQDPFASLNLRMRVEEMNPSLRWPFPLERKRCSRFRNFKSNSGLRISRFA